MKKNNLIKILLLVILTFAFQSCDKQLSVSPPMSPVPVGFIHIDSRPRGALIYEDGRNSGMRTPASLNWLEEKTYLFTLKKELYRDTSFTVTITEGDSEYIFVDYYKDPWMRGTIYCNTNTTGASIYLNDSLLQEKTPLKIKGLIPGKYRVKYSKAGFRTDSTTAIVHSGKVADAVVSLTDTTYWVDFNTRTSQIPDNSITAIKVDDNNVKWIGTLEKGLVAYDDKNWTFYNSSNSPLPGNTVTTIYIDKTNRVWVGTLSGAAVLDHGSWEVFTTENCPLPTNIINDIDVQDDGTYWLATRMGLLKHSNGFGWYFYDSLKSGLPHRWVTSIAHDDLGNMWIGSNGFGLAKLTPDGEWKVYLNYMKLGAKYEKAPFPSNIVSRIETYKNEVWIGFNPDPTTRIGGLVRYRQGRWYTHYNPLPSHIIFSIDLQTNTQNGMLRKWISTYQGLVTFVDFSDRIEYRRVNTPLNVENFHGVAFDKKTGYIWVATYGGGLYKLKKKF